jgi:protein gp37
MNSRWLWANSWWWDRTWNWAFGCSHVGRGCKNCCVQHAAGAYSWPADHHAGVTIRAKQGKEDERFVFNGVVKVASPDHPIWLFPLLYRGAKHPKLGPGQPSLIWAVDMGDPFHEQIPTAVIKTACAKLAASHHIGLLLTKRCQRMTTIIVALSAEERRLWQPKLWLGFSAEGQREFDQRWPEVRPLAEDGWLVFASLAPLIEKIELPADFLSLGRWAIASGEQGVHVRCREMDPDWARRIRDQCAEANVKFFMKQMARLELIPYDLQIREFPKATC